MIDAIGNPKWQQHTNPIYRWQPFNRYDCVSKALVILYTFYTKRRESLAGEDSTFSRVGTKSRLISYDAFLRSHQVGLGLVGFAATAKFVIDKLGRRNGFLGDADGCFQAGFAQEGER